MSALLTNFTLEHLKTITSDKTNVVDNVNFLRTVFGEKSDDACPVVVSFAGNPTNVSSNKWFGRPWTGDTSSIPLGANANNYFSLARFQPDEKGQYRRRKSHFQGLYAVMLDDLGSKVSLDRLTLPPSWLLETSPGNYQAGYLLDKPLTEGKTADKLMNAIINAGLCDPGATGPMTRLARLPIAVNAKHEPPFFCRMVIWEPERRYSVENLKDGLQLEIIEIERLKREKGQTHTDHVDGDSVWIPRPEENIVLTALRFRNLYKV